MNTLCAVISTSYSPSPPQYGNIFTFVLLGRRVTVALGPEGNNFIMGGKHTVMSAEDAYTVRPILQVALGTADSLLVSST